MMVLAMRKHFNPVAIGGLVLYGASLAVLLRNQNFEPGGALIVLVFFGIIFPALAWLTTLRAVPLSILVHPTAREMFVLITCIVTLSVYLIGGPQRINNYLPQTWIDSPQIKFFITLTKKLIAFALIPFGIFRFAFGYRLRNFGIQEEGLRALCRNHLPMVLVVGGALVAFQFLLGNGAAPIRHGKFTAHQLLQYARTAWLAVNRYFMPQVVIPMHYGPLPGSSSEVDILAVVGKDARVKFMKPGETRKF
jgi:hypothetical protein